MSAEKPPVTVQTVPSTPVLGDVALGAVRVLRRRPLKGRNRIIVLELLKRLQNGKCFYAFDCCTKRLTVIAHKNHDSSDDDPDNLAGSCEACNKRISNQARGKMGSSIGMAVRVREGVERSMVHMPGERTASEQKHETAWPRFVKFAQDMLEREGTGFPYEDFVRMSAKVAGVSVYTVENRYIRREDCSRGFLRVFRRNRGGEKVVMLNREIREEDFEP